jgi:transposase
MTKKYTVTLSDEERQILGEVLYKANGGQRRKRARCLLLADEQKTDRIIAEQVGMHRRGVENLRRRFAEAGFQATLDGKPRGHRPRALTGEDEARLIALIASPAPAGHDHWDLRLIRDTWAALEGTHTRTVSHETIRQTLKKLFPQARPKRE